MLIGLAGDVMIGRLVNEYLDKAAPSYIWGDVLPLLAATDLNLINLETALTTSTKEVAKTFNFKADPGKVSALVSGHIHAVNIANNHILDYSEEGLIETLATLDKAKIHHVGAGKNAREAAKPVILEKKGIKLGILGCTDNEPFWVATAKDPGTRYLEVGDLESIREDIIRLKKEADLLILSIHWGPNMREIPSLAFRAFAHSLIEIGVDVIHGHSAHIFQGVEIHKGKLILYDTGDFVDDYYVDPDLRNDRSFFFLLEVSKKGLLTLRLVPTLISNFQVNLAKKEKVAVIMDRMELLSQEFHTPWTRKSTELIIHF